MNRRSHVLLAVARLDRAFHLLRDRGQRAEAQSGLLARREREPRVLERQLERERGREVAVDHQLALEVRVGRADRAAVDGVEEGLRVDAERLGQRDRLRQALGQRQQPGVEHELEPAARARLAQPQRLRPDRVEDRADPLADVLRPGGEHDQLALLRGRLGAEHRRVDERHARRQLGDAGGRLGPDRAHLDEHPVDARERLAHDRLDRVAVGEHGDHDLGAVHRGGDLGGRLHAVEPLAPSPACGSRRVTSWPAAARLRAIGAPMIPVPRTATRMRAASP